MLDRLKKSWFLHILYGTRTDAFGSSQEALATYLHFVLSARRLVTARRAMPLSLSQSLSYSGSLGLNLTMPECDRATAQMCSGPSSHGRQCVAEDLVTRTFSGPDIAHLPLSSWTNQLGSIENEGHERPSQPSVIASSRRNRQSRTRPRP